MSESAKINLVGVDKETLLSNIAKIRDWDNGHNYPIIVIGKEGKEHEDTIDNVWQAINDDKIDEYLSQPHEARIIDMENFEDLTPKQDASKPDIVHRGSIEFEVQWFGNKADIIVDELDNYKRVVIMQQVLNDFTHMQRHMNTRGVTGYSKKDKEGIAKAIKLINKFINSYLTKAWLAEHTQQTPIDPRKADNPKEEDITADAFATPTMTVVKDIHTEAKENFGTDEKHIDI